MRRVALILLAVVSCSSLFANDWSGPSWPTWRGPHGNGIVDLSASPAAVTKGKVLWTTSVGEGYSATCVVGNHRQAGVEHRRREPLGGNAGHTVHARFQRRQALLHDT